MAAFMRRINLEDHLLEKRESLHQQEKNTMLAAHISRLRSSFLKHREDLLKTRTWMISSTARGGGVAEMLPRIMALMREMGMFVEWCVLDPGPDPVIKEHFFAMTKTIHNNVHSDGVPLDRWNYKGAGQVQGAGEPQEAELPASAASEGVWSVDHDPALEARLAPHRVLFERVARDATDSFFTEFLKPLGGPDPNRDIFIVHDPQPCAMVRYVKERCPSMLTIWRCHIGLDLHNDATRAAWAFMRPYISAYDQAVFSAPEYVPPYLVERSSCVPPGIAPSAPKNKEMSPFEITQTLMRAGIMHSSQARLLGEPGCELIEPPFTHTAKIHVHPTEIRSHNAMHAEHRHAAAEKGVAVREVLGTEPRDFSVNIASHPSRLRRAFSPATSSSASNTPRSSQGTQTSPKGPEAAAVLAPVPSPMRRYASAPDLLQPSLLTCKLPRLHVRGRRLPRFSIPSPWISPRTVTPVVPLTPSGTLHACSSCLMVEQGISMMHRPVVTQISRWDRLKGWMPLMMAFVLLKEDPAGWVERLVVGEQPQAPRAAGDTAVRLQMGSSECAGCLSPEASQSYSPARHLALLRNCVLVLAGPDPRFIADDPEGLEVLNELKTYYDSLEPSVAADIRIVELPMENPVENALMVNAMQRASFVVVQNSLREGFGLTATEAMYKRTPFVGTAQAVGLRTQVRHGIDGVLVQGDPSIPKNVASALNLILGDSLLREEVAVNGQKTAVEKFLIFAQLQSWMQIVLALRRVRARTADIALGASDELSNMGPASPLNMLENHVAKMPMPAGTGMPGQTSGTRSTEAHASAFFHVPRVSDALGKHHNEHLDGGGTEQPPPHSGQPSFDG